MPKCCINFLASPTLTVLTPVPHIALCERQIPSCVSLSKPIAQHFRYLSSAEKDLSTADIHRCGLIVCCATNHICVSGGFGFAVPLCRAGFGMCSGAAVALLFLWRGEQCPGRHWAPAADSQEQPGWMFWRCLQPALSGRGALRLGKAPVQSLGMDWAMLEQVFFMKGKNCACGLSKSG